jgi:hypothetical protein
MKNINIKSNFSKNLNSENQIKYQDSFPHERKDIVKAIIKAQTSFKKGAVYLVQWNDNVKRYNLIGGHVKPDESPINAIKRKLNEELNLNILNFSTDYILNTLITVSKEEISLTTGKYTQYNIHYFLPLFINRNSLDLLPIDKWVTKGELLCGITKNGEKINETAIVEFDKALPGGLDALTFSQIVV